MPSTLRTLVAHAADAARRPFDPNRIRRQQQGLLYGGGAAITLFIVVCVVLVLRLEVMACFTQARESFLRREAQLYTELQSTRLLLGQYANQSQSLWRSGARLSDDELRAFVEQHGKVVLKRLGNDAFVGFATIDAAHPPATYSPYLALIYRQLESVATQTPVDVGLTAYLIGTQGEFVGVFNQPLVGRALAMPAGVDLSALMHEVMPPGAVPPPDATQSHDVRIDTHVDPLLRRSVVRFTRALYDEDGRPFAWIVANGRPRLERFFASDTIDEEHALIDGDANILIGTQRVGGLAARALDFARTATGDRVAIHRVGGRFVIGDRLPNSDQVLMTTFSWRSVAETVAAPAAITIGLALGAITLLWCGIVLFDRRALRPANRRAIRLIESEALNRTLIRTAPAGLMLLSVADGETLVRNDTMRAYDEAAAGEPLGKRIWRAYGTRAEHARVVTQELAVEFAGKGPTYLAANVLRTRYRGVDVLLCTVLDVTTRKQTEDKLREARESADDANRAKSTFLATMSHEIRTPLNAIVGNLELMERAALPPAEARRLKTIISSSDVLLRMINDVLDLSKAESNQMVLEAVPFDLCAVLRDVAAIFRPLAEGRQLTLDCRIAPGLADGYVGDPTRLRQLVSNLVGNAIKFTEQGGVTIDARVAPDDGGEPRVAISVSDTGVGIPADALPTLFDVYIQADPSIYRRFGGTGLGLPLCRRIAQAMRGTLKVTSTPGEGSTFVAGLPLPAAPAGWRAVHEEDDAELPVAPVEDEACALRVLVAEDHPASRALLRDQFAALGHDATIVGNGIEAMRAYFSQPFDLVLTDLGMPEMDGFALANFLREQGAAVPVIAMTAHATDEDYRRCTQAGAVEVVLKPLSIGALDAVLRRHAPRGQAASPAGDATSESRPPITDEIRRMLRAATLHSLAGVDEALQRGDAESVRIELHSMRGGFALAGEAVARDACAQAERTLSQRGVAALEPEWPACRAAIVAALERIAAAA
ncbi:ATP-binding protein [Burkholderia cenocepacia]|uniref:ATP-binding protein n=1 Tax=Burkholderia cenocepacia TaxID=95486 RepID=UPI002AB65719|nr:ATP-binding protein [Burkholderia cenocepacia]